MLNHLHISNIVLVDDLHLDFSSGLTTLTGETGAGKSILLDAIGLVIGGRGDSTLVRQGTHKAVITATFTPPHTHPVWHVLNTLDIPYDTHADLILRRSLTADGKSRATVNGTPTTIGDLRAIGDTLIDVQGQFEQHGLLSPKNHLSILDSYADVHKHYPKLHDLYRDWQHALDAYQTTKADVENAQKDADYIVHCLAELDAITPQAGEYETLQQKITELKNANRLLDDYNTAYTYLSGDNGAIPLLNRTEKILENIRPIMGDAVSPLLDSLISATENIQDISARMNAFANDIESQAMDANTLSDRLYALNDLAKKHRTTVDGLVDIHAELATKHKTITSADDTIHATYESLQSAHQAYMDFALHISRIRTQYAQNLGNTVCAELPNLALNGAEFTVVVSQNTVDTCMDIAHASPLGMDTAVFHARTNQGGIFSPIHKSASGGELSRILLAINVALSHTNTSLTLMFDEIDAGVGGASAKCIGERVKALATTHQVFVITHSPQVASCGTHHMFVQKHNENGITTSHITPLVPENRIQEIARMLSGDGITDEAINNAKVLLGQ